MILKVTVINSLRKQTMKEFYQRITVSSKQQQKADRHVKMKIKPNKIKGSTAGLKGDQIDQRPDQ